MRLEGFSGISACLWPILMFRRAGHWNIPWGCGDTGTSVLSGDMFSDPTSVVIWKPILMILGAPDVPVLVGPFLSTSQDSTGPSWGTTAPDHTVARDKKAHGSEHRKHHVCWPCPVPWLMVGVREAGDARQPPRHCLLGLPACRCSSLRLTWYTGERPSSSTRCVRTTSTCCPPMPTCVCESLCSRSPGPRMGRGCGWQGLPGAPGVS